MIFASRGEMIAAARRQSPPKRPLEWAGPPHALLCSSWRRAIPRVAMCSSAFGARQESLARATGECV
jgi:hypothetical protein